jgi:pyrrolysine biosynthesis protein PylC
MTRLCIVGGALQGMEAAYLGHKAGYQTAVIDRRPDAPANSLCDDSYLIDPVKDPEEAMAVFRDCDAVLPANEDLELLERLDRMLDGTGIPLLFDISSYRLSCSKLRSNETMAKLGVPMPKKWPCNYPVIVKPSCQSGSVGVTAVLSPDGMGHALAKVQALNDEPVIEEYVQGRNISVEAIGNGTECVPYFLTEVVLDGGYDCKAVRCDRSHDCGAEKELGSYIERIGRSIGLNGIMDIEAIEGRDGMRVLEIDARIPSQTPAAIEGATGINLLSELLGSREGHMVRPEPRCGCSVYEHYFIDGKTMRTCGEKMFSHVRSPEFVSGLFGSDDAITNYSPGKDRWYATLIFKDNDMVRLDNRRAASRQQMIEECGIETFSDESPKAIV